MDPEVLQSDAVGEGRIYALILQRESWGDILSAFGELDLSVADEFAAAVNARLAVPRPLVLNFEYCNYIDSTILRVLVRTVNGERDRFGIIVPKETRIRRIFEMTGLEEALAILHSRDEARERFTEGT